MQIPERLIRLAKQRALSGFSALVEKTVGEADHLLSKSAGGDQRGIGAARALLRAEGGVLRVRMSEHYDNFLARALQTMHTDLRAGLHNINADNLTLIDDEVVIRQMEVDRLVTRLRDADSISLGRINLIIAQIHDEVEVRERENPFRPYLLARALHEGLREIARDETTQKLLFDTMSLAMASQVPGFYSGILDVFEAGGLNSRLTARPSAMTRAQRDRLAWQKAADQLIGRADPSLAALDNPVHAAQARILPRLKQLMDGHAVEGGAAGNGAPHHAGQGGAAAGQAREQAHALQDLVWEVFRQPRLARFAHGGGHHAPADAPPPPGQRTRLDMQLMQMQRAAARDLALDDPALPTAKPLDVREQVSEPAASPQAKVTMDLVSLLFESIVHDDQLPAPVRKQLGLLHVPFLRAAILDPSMLHEADHPARRLLDRIGTLSTGMPEGSPGFAALHTEIGKALATVLERFDNDTAIFAEAEAALDAVVASLIPAGAPALAPYAIALDDAERAAARLPDTVAALGELLAPLHVDPRVTSFVTRTWARVLALASPTAATAQTNLLGELLWSAQEKVTPEERTALMRLLPELVKCVRQGLGSLDLPEAESKAALDMLVAVHMDVLGNKQLPAIRHMSLDEWRQHFAHFVPGQAGTTELAEAPALDISRAMLEKALAGHGVNATLMTDHDHLPPRPAETAWLSMARPGAAFELLHDGVFRAARLNLVSARAMLFLFTLAEKPTPTIFYRPALLAAMRSGTLHTAEHAPVFERAVDSLLAGADALAPPSPGRPAARL